MERRNDISNLLAMYIHNTKLCAQKSKQWSTTTNGTPCKL